MSKLFRSLRPGRAALALVAGLLLLAGLAAAPAPADPRRAVNGHVDVVEPKAPVADASVTADGETEPVGAAGDAADDLAFWVHPGDPSQSVVIGTDKEGALEVYDMAGKRLQAIDPTSRPGTCAPGSCWPGRPSTSSGWSATACASTPSTRPHGR